LITHKNSKGDNCATVKEMLKRRPKVKEKLWRGGILERFMQTRRGNVGIEETITSYVKAQGKGKDYKQLQDKG
jgi:hypothetical protein